MALTQVKAAGLIADAIDASKLADDSIDSEHYNAASIDNEHLADDAVGVPELSATGTAGNTTYLRGDNTWTVPPDTNTQVAIDDTPVDGVTNEAISSNWAYDHNAGTGNSKHVPAAGSSGQFLKHDGTWGTPPDTNTQVGGATGVDFNDSIVTRWGTGNDLEIYHDGTNSNIKNSEGVLYARGSDVRITNAGATETMVKAVADGAVEIYYDNAKKAETVTGGFTVTGTCTATAFAGDGSNLTGISGGVSSDGQDNTVAGTDAGDAFSGSDALGNSFFGKNAGTSVTTGDYNHGFGADALAVCQTGSNNVAIGKSALYNATHSHNTCVGYYSGNALTSGQYNTALGAGSMQSNQTAGYNVAVGYGSMASSTGGNNVAVGYNALNASGGQNSIGIGHSAGLLNTSDNNVFIGSYAGDANTSGSSNTAIGKSALSACSTNGTNTCVGASAGQDITGPGNTCIGASAFTTGNTGSNNVMMGYLTGQYKTGASNSNVAIGAYSFRGGDEGTQNTCLGTSSGSVISTGDSNVCIGQAAGSYITTGSDNIFIGHATGMLGSPTGVYTTGSNVLSLGSNVISDFYCADTSISSSDKRDKTDIAEWTHGLDWINKLKPVTYRWDKRAFYSSDYSITPDGSKKWQRQHLGFLAQDVLEVEKSFGYAGKKDDMLTVNLNCDDTAYGMKYERLVVVLTKAVQELSAKNDALEARIATLEAV